jgi:hypothetical protein
MFDYLDDEPGDWIKGVFYFNDDFGEATEQYLDALIDMDA